MADLLIIETGNGGDVVLNGNDFVLIDGLSNMPYLAMFGGNVEVSSDGESNDWWGNSLLMFNEPDIQYISVLERTLKNIALSSSSIQTIKRAVAEDLAFMQDFSDIKIDIQLIGIDRISIYLKITKLDGLEIVEFNYLWDSTTNELNAGDIVGITNGNGIALNNVLNFGL
jgi:hypothetical protein